MKITFFILTFLCVLSFKGFSQSNNNDKDCVITTPLYDYVKFNFLENITSKDSSKYVVILSSGFDRDLYEKKNREINYESIINFVIRIKLFDGRHDIIRVGNSSRNDDIILYHENDLYLYTLDRYFSYPEASRSLYKNVSYDCKDIKSIEITEGKSYKPVRFVCED